MVREMREAIRIREGTRPTDKPKVVQFGFMTYTVICPKCGNVVGSIDAGADWWLTFGTRKNKNGKASKRLFNKGYSINIPGYDRKKNQGKAYPASFMTADKAQMNPWLKPWARWPKLKKKKPRVSAIQRIVRDANRDNVSHIDTGDSFSRKKIKVRVK
jgi:hypothetical protein